MKLTKKYYRVRRAQWGSVTQHSNGVLTINREELIQAAGKLTGSIEQINLHLVHPGESTRIIHILDTLQPMCKIQGKGDPYSGFFGSPCMVGEGVTGVLEGFTVMQSAPLPWDSSSASSGLLYPREAIMDMTGPYQGITPFAQTVNLVITYQLAPGKSAEEYDRDIRMISLRISSFLANKATSGEADHQEVFSIEEQDLNLPNVVLVWQVQNQGVYANTFLYGKAVDEMVPTLLHPNEMLDGCIVSGNYVWPAFKVPTYLHVNHPILLDLYHRHGKDLNFKGVIFSRSHNPTHWHKERSAGICVKLARMLKADGLVMAWEGGGNAATDGMLTIQMSERAGIKTSAITFEFGGADGTEGILLVDDVPEADAIISGSSIEKPVRLPAVERVIGGDKLRLDKEAGGRFPDAQEEIEFSTTTLLYCSGNQAGHSHFFAEAY
jgi:glycine reductase